MASAAEREWSPMQSAIFAAVEDPTAGNLVVEALAGTGKSTTIEEAVGRTSESDRVLVCAFNASIAKALEPRMPEGVEVRTLHSFGFAALRRALAPKRPEINRFRMADVAEAIFGGRGWDTRQARSFCCQLAGIAKGQAFDALKDASKLDRLDRWVDAYGLDVPKGFDRKRLVGNTLQMLRTQQCGGHSEIDFDDQIWLPVVLGLEIPSYDFVFVDETQDLNPAQLEIIKRAGRKGRIVAVGDRRQAIYGFRGADSRAIPRMIEELGAKTLPLSITYRCPKAVVAEANAIVPELQAAPTAPEGIVRTVSPETLEREVAAGDFVLSRTNAPLVSLCFKLVKAGKRAAIQGRAIGDGLANWVKATNAATVAELMNCLRDWRRAEVERLEALERDTEAVIDRAECLEAIASGATSVDAVLTRIERLFTNEDPTGRVLLSSTHRAKGLEADRVWLLRDTYMKFEGPEEANLLYVAITRSKRELIYVVEGAITAAAELG